VNVLDVLNHLFGIPYKEYASLDVNNPTFGKFKLNHAFVHLMHLTIQDQNALIAHYLLNGKNLLNLASLKIVTLVLNLPIQLTQQQIQQLIQQLIQQQTHHLLANLTMSWM
jgi:hypothetical protein